MLTAADKVVESYLFLTMIPKEKFEEMKQGKLGLILTIGEA